MSELIDIRGVPEVHKMLAQFTPRELTNRTRRALRAGGAVMRKEMRQKGNRKGFYPKGFKSTRTRNHQHPLGVSVSPKSPLSTIFEHGARPHMEPNPWVGRETQHPGMAARPFIAPVFAAGQSPATVAMEKTLFEGL